MKSCSWTESLTFHDSHHAPLRSNSVCVEKERKEEEGKEEGEKKDFHIAVLYIVRFTKKKEKKKNRFESSGGRLGQ